MSVAVQSNPIVRTTRRALPRASNVTAKRGLGPVILLLVVWQVLGDADSLTFPPPAQWIEAIREMHSDGILLPALGVTLRTFIVSLILASVAGVAVGTLIGSSRWADRTLSPFLDFVRTVPPPAIVPIAILLLGTSLTMSASVVALTIVWPVLLNTASTVSSIPPVRLDMSRTIGLTPWERLTKVLLPSLIPGIVVGIRVAVSISLVVTLFVDILGSGAGLGRLMIERQQSFDSSAVWGLLLLIGALGYLLNAGFSTAEKRLLRNFL